MNSPIINTIKPKLNTVPNTVYAGLYLFWITSYIFDNGRLWKYFPMHTNAFSEKINVYAITSN
ncbi:hypothetical protein [Escherichia phage vB_EcoM_CRJP21]|uniref:Uncharacterized protein n=1 Tax=Escherichia phage SP27 TaxID=2495557 RepID=A0A5A4U2Y2_9CAUD|nr:hypothetical protein [Escherichia phage vB_EcoM_CRJP21]BBM61799.1 hypothetical protein EO157G_2100 [Escherichia phage SP27]